MYLPSLLLTGIWPGTAAAQVAIQSAAIESGLISPRTFFHATLFNPGPPSEVSLEGVLHTRTGEAVLSFRTEPFRMPAGGFTVLASQLRMQSFLYGAGPVGKAAQRFQRLPGGEYAYCIHLRSDETGDEFCDELQVEEFLFLDLVQPWDGDTIEETRPALTWMMAGSGPSLTTADIRLVLVPERDGRTPAQSLAAERPLFMLPHVKERTVPFPVGVAELERGKCYAWQVERLEGSRIVDRSEPWGFCVRRTVVPDANKYVLLRTDGKQTIYQATEDRLFFRTDERYANSELHCRILNARQVPLTPIAKKVDLSASSVERSNDASKNVGANLYEVDLAPYDLGNGLYDLIVTDEKANVFRLAFQINH